MFKVVIEHVLYFVFLFSIIELTLLPAGLVVGMGVVDGAKVAEIVLPDIFVVDEVKIEENVPVDVVAMSHSSSNTYLKTNSAKIKIERWRKNMNFLMFYR